MESMNFKNNDWNNLEKLLHADVTDFNCFSENFPMNFSIEITNFKSSIPIVADQVIMEQNNNHQLLQPFQLAQLSQQFFLPPPLLPPIAPLVYEPATVAAPQEWIDFQQQPMIWDNIHPTFTLPMSTPLIQTHTEKNQLTKTIYELMREEVIDDSWIWKKNGEKKIKDSQFPRNYYKCATSKDCKAKKYIEKSSKGENFFLVAYYGEHNHPPPTSQRSCASFKASTKYKYLKGINVVPKALRLNSSSASSSKCSKRSRVVASSIVSTVPMIETESTSLNKDKMVSVAMEHKGDDGEEENVVSIPNKFVSENILMDFEKLNAVTTSTK